MTLAEVARRAARATVMGVVLFSCRPQAAAAADNIAPAPIPIPSPSPTPAPAPSLVPAATGLHTSFFTRAFDASILTNSNLPGGQNQTDAVGFNAFAVLHADYDFGATGLLVGASYYYAMPNPLTQGSYISQLLESYVGYKQHHVTAEVGNQFFASPWANTHDVYGLAPTAFQGADLIYAPNAWTFEVADMTRFENRTATQFTRSTLLTSYPVGAPGLPSNIYVPGGGAIYTNGFAYARVSYAPEQGSYSLNGYLYNVSDLLNMVWLTGKATLSSKGWTPSLAAQGGVENNAGVSYLGKIQSSVFGFQLGLNPSKTVSVSAGFDSIPWQRDNIVLPAGVSCNSGGTMPTDQVTTVNATLPYFLPQGTAQCSTNADQSTNIYYGGWASPYTDSYASDPLFTTSLIEGMADRHSPGTAAIVDLTYTSVDKRWNFTTSYAWYNYGNTVASQATTEWDVLAAYHFSKVVSSPYKGFLLRYFYGQQSKSNVAYATGASYLGGLPLLRYSRVQLEYGFGGVGF